MALGGCPWASLRARKQVQLPVACSCLQHLEESALPSPRLSHPEKNRVG